MRCRLALKASAIFGSLGAYGVAAAIISREHYNQFDAKLEAALGTLDASKDNSVMTAANQLQAFVNAVKTGSALPVNLDDGVAALAMAEAATQSAKNGSPVKLVEILG